MADKSYRNIRPSFGESSRTGQSHKDDNIDGGRASPDPRRKTGDTPKHRKVPESVTRNACLNCKKARAKCDGKTPCKRCSSRGESQECIYEIHLKHAKEDLVKQIKELQAKDALSQQILQALATNNQTPEVLQMLRDGEPPELIVRNLGKPVTTASPRSDSTSPTADFARADHQASFELRTTSWTSVTMDKAVLDHLFQLYFAWVHPVHTLFSEGQFVHSYHAGRNGDNSYCSTLLVNALCARACYLHLPLETDTIDFRKLGEDFVEAVKNAVEPGDCKLTTIQAYAAMFLVEITRGDALMANAYLEIAVNSLSQVKNQAQLDASDVWKNTVWGLQELNVEWSLLTFRAPPSIEMSSAHDNIADDERVDLSRWHIYSTPSGAVSSWPSLQATTTRQKAALVSIIKDIVHTLYAEHQPAISATSVLRLYQRLVIWREDLADIIVNVEANNNGHNLPHVLSLLILYANAVVQLLQPTLALDGFPTHLVEDIIWTHAQQGLAFLGNQYRAQFPLRCQSVLQMYSLIHFVDVIARHFPGGIEGYSTDGPQAIKLGIDILEESIHSAPVALIMQEMLRRTARSCSIRLSNIESQVDGTKPGSTKRYVLDDIIRACTRPTFNQPLREIARRYTPTFASDWLAHRDTKSSSQLPWRDGDSNTPDGPEAGSHGFMHIRNLLN